MGFLRCFHSCFPQTESSLSSSAAADLKAKYEEQVFELTETIEQMREAHTADIEQVNLSSDICKL
jgi:hypothetical protein